MSQTFRSFTVCFTIALGMLALMPSPALASDFGPMVTQALFILAAMVGAALILGATTAAVLVWAYRRKWVWFLIPIFAVCWFAVILGLHELWINRNADQYRDWKPPKAPIRFDLPTPEGIPPAEGTGG